MNLGIYTCFECTVFTKRKNIAEDEGALNMAWLFVLDALVRAFQEVSYWIVKRNYLKGLEGMVRKRKEKAQCQKPGENG